MSWEQRLREMVLAGGALAAVGCSSSLVSPSGTDGGPSQSPSDSSPSPSPPEAGKPDATNPSTFCCNANADPCCPQLYCGAPRTPECTSRLEGGGPDDFGPPDAAAVDASDASDAWSGALHDAGDALSDAAGMYSPFCCNANPDPCCRSFYCGDPMTAACACKADGGTWSYAAPPGAACSFPSEAGFSDTDAGADGHD